MLRPGRLPRVLRLGPTFQEAASSGPPRPFHQNRVQDTRGSWVPPHFGGHQKLRSPVGESTAKLKSLRRAAWIVDRTNGDRIRCYFDGACPRNQFGTKGRMKAAFAVGDHEIFREVPDLQTSSGPLRSNNIAEYIALILLLEHVHQIGRRTRPKGYVICGDSQLVTRQMQGEYRVKTPHLVPLHAGARELSSDLDIEFRWVPRDQNLAGILLEASPTDPKGSSRGI